MFWVANEGAFNNDAGANFLRVGYAADEEFLLVVAVHHLNQFDAERRRNFALVSQRTLAAMFDRNLSMGVEDMRDLAYIDVDLVRAAILGADSNGLTSHDADCDEILVARSHPALAFVQPARDQGLPEREGVDRIARRVLQAETQLSDRLALRLRHNLVDSEFCTDGAKETLKKLHADL